MADEMARTRQTFLIGLIEATLIRYVSFAVFPLEKGQLFLGKLNGQLAAKLPWYSGHSKRGDVNLVKVLTQRYFRRFLIITRNGS
jgi:hypothetical protein